MLKLTDKGVDGNGAPQATRFEAGDLIDIRRDQHECITISVTRDANTESARKLFLGENLSYSLSQYFGRTAGPTVYQVWAITNLFLQASWILAETELVTDDCILARVIRVATCREEMNPELPCCGAGGDGYGRD